MQTLFDISLLILIAGAGITAALATIMGFVLACRSFRRSDDDVSPRIAALMFLIVSIDAATLWLLSDVWGNSEPLAAGLAAAGFAGLALGFTAVSRTRQYHAVLPDEDAVCQDADPRSETQTPTEEAGS